MPGVAKRAIRTLIAVYAVAQLLQACASHWLGVVLVSAAALLGAHVLGQHFHIQLRRPSSSNSQPPQQQHQQQHEDKPPGIDAGAVPGVPRQGPYPTTTTTTSSASPGPASERVPSHKPAPHAWPAAADVSADADLTAAAVGSAAAGGGGVPGVVRDHGAWRQQVGSEEVADAWELLAGSIVQEFVYDAWFCWLSPDKEVPGELRWQLHAAFGALAARARGVEWGPWLVRHLSLGMRDALQLYRRAAAAADHHHQQQQQQQQQQLGGGGLVQPLLPNPITSLSASAAAGAMEGVGWGQLGHDSGSRGAATAASTSSSSGGGGEGGGSGSGRSRREEVEAFLLRDPGLHVACRAAGGHYKVLRSLSSMVLSRVLPPDARDCLLMRGLLRELLACCGLRNTLMYLKPYSLNKLLLHSLQQQHQQQQQQQGAGASAAATGASPTAGAPQQQQQQGQQQQQPRPCLETAGRFAARVRAHVAAEQLARATAASSTNTNRWSGGGSSAAHWHTLGLASTHLVPSRARPEGRGMPKRSRSFNELLLPRSNTLTTVNPLRSALSITAAAARRGGAGFRAVGSASRGRARKSSIGTGAAAAAAAAAAAGRGGAVGVTSHLLEAPVTLMRPGSAPMSSWDGTTPSSLRGVTGAAAQRHSAAKAQQQQRYTVQDWSIPAHRGPRGWGAQQAGSSSSRAVEESDRCQANSQGEGGVTAAQGVGVAGEGRQGSGAWWEDGEEVSDFDNRGGGSGAESSTSRRRDAATRQQQQGQQAAAAWAVPPVASGAGEGGGREGLGRHLSTPHRIDSSGATPWWVAGGSLEDLGDRSTLVAPVNAQVTTYHLVTKQGGSSSSKASAVFHIQVEDAVGRWQVERRFRHFEALHKLLRQQSGAALRASGGSLPPKRHLTPRDAVFLAKRSWDLNRYLQCLLVHPLLSTSGPLAAFLLPGEPLSLDGLRTRSASSSYSWSGDYSGPLAFSAAAAGGVGGGVMPSGASSSSSVAATGAKQRARLGRTMHSPEPAASSTTTWLEQPSPGTRPLLTHPSHLSHSSGEADASAAGGSSSDGGDSTHGGRLVHAKSTPPGAIGAAAGGGGNAGGSSRRGREDGAASPPFPRSTNSRQGTSCLNVRGQLSQQQADAEGTLQANHEARIDCTAAAVGQTPQYSEEPAGDAEGQLETTIAAASPPAAAAAGGGGATVTPVPAKGAGSRLFERLAGSMLPGSSDKAKKAGAAAAAAGASPEVTNGTGVQVPPRVRRQSMDSAMRELQRCSAGGGGGEDTSHPAGLYVTGATGRHPWHPGDTLGSLVTAAGAGPAGSPQQPHQQQQRGGLLAAEASGLTAGRGEAASSGLLRVGSSASSSIGEGPDGQQLQLLRKGSSKGRRATASLGIGIGIRSRPLPWESGSRQAGRATPPLQQQQNQQPAGSGREGGRQGVSSSPSAAAAVGSGGAQGPGSTNTTSSSSSMPPRQQQQQQQAVAWTIGSSSFPPHMAAGSPGGGGGTAAPEFVTGGVTSGVTATGYFRPLYDLVDCIFQLSSKGLFRRNAILFGQQLLSLMIGGTIEDYLQRQLDKATSEASISQALVQMQAQLWPGGIWYAWAQPAAPPAPAPAAAAIPEGGEGGKPGAAAVKAPGGAAAASGTPAATTTSSTSASTATTSTSGSKPGGKVWPAGMTPATYMDFAVPPTDAPALAEAARTLLQGLPVPPGLGAVLGKGAYHKTLAELHEVMQCEPVMMHLGHRLVQELLVALFPEIAEEVAALHAAMAAQAAAGQDWRQG